MSGDRPDAGAHADTDDRTGPGVTADVGADRRGQTVIDFAIGAALFVVVMAAVLAFVPGMLDPFTGEQSDIQLADRLASHLAADTLGDPARPHVLNRTCTVEFFDGDGTAGAGPCRFATDSGDLDAALNVEERVNLNVTVEDETGIVADGGVDLRAGPTAPTGSNSVTVAQRAVLYGEETYRLFVRVW